MVQHRQCAARQQIAATWALLTLLGSGDASARAFDEIRISQIGTESTIEIELECEMRYAEHSPARGGDELRIQLSLGQDCHNALRGLPNELRRPTGARMAKLAEIEFDKPARNLATVTLRFLSPVAFRIKQTANPYLLTVVVDSRAPVNALTSPPPPPQSIESPTTRPPTTIREPGRQVRSPPSPGGDLFVIRVAVLTELEEVNYAALEPFRSKVVYTNEITVGDRRWAELRVGFFDTEPEAQQALTQLGLSFDTAWITVANAQEQADARTHLFSWPDTEQLKADATSRISSVAVNQSATTIPAERATAMMEEARVALLRRDPATSIELYTKLLEAPGGAYRREAREFLGVALEKNDQSAHAIAAYSAYLDEFPNGPDARRVQQRLAALSVPVQRGTAKSSAAETARDSSGWEVYGDVSQFYLRGVDLSQDDEPEFIAQSALLSQAQIIARHQGQRFDFVGRGNLSYLYDLVENGSGDQALVSYAYVDITDTNTEFNARVGRQTQHTGGVLGRFDGAHASYRVRSNLAVNMTAGFPVDSARFLADSEHYFYGASLDLDNVLGAWDFSIFTNLQSVDGISDREAFGAETRYHSTRLNLVGLLDYDASYNIINTALATGSWRINNRLSLYGRVRGGVAPFLTTRNAIIGQPVNTVRELFPSYTEGQIRRLARNRTADERAASAGLSVALTSRLQLKGDFSYFEYNGSVASGGVQAFPDSGQQYSYGGQLIGSGFVKAGHVFVVGYRHDEQQSVDADTFWLDMRYPVGERLRIQSRLNVSRRIANQNPAGDIDHWIADPVLRVLYKWKRRYRVELEIGGRWSNREYPVALAPPLTPENVDESSSYYLQLGYTLDF
jgi:hypothetical protein